MVKSKLSNFKSYLLGVGNGKAGAAEENNQCPMPNAQCSMPHAQLLSNVSQ
ncbi:MAG: hypothetical protein V7K36_13270 [Nostoc sp.]